MQDAFIKRPFARIALVVTVFAPQPASSLVILSTTGRAQTARGDSRRASASHFKKTVLLKRFWQCQ